MKLIIAVVQDHDVGALLDSLAEEKFGATRLASTGGFLRQGNTTVLVGVEEEQVEKVISLIRQVCQPRAQFIPAGTEMGGLGRPMPTFLSQPLEVTVGGAAVFVLDVDQFLRL